MKRGWTGWLAAKAVVLALLIGMAGMAGAQQQGDRERAVPPPPPPPPVAPAQGNDRPPGRHANWPGQPGHDRMSPEERKQLRRDINEHGREIYRERRQGR